jgi:hypothetical protein
MKRRRNTLVWTGFAIVLAAFLSYIPLFVLFPSTRDVPWVNLLLFLVGGGLIALGLKRAHRQPEVYRGKVSGAILAALSLLLTALFCYVTFYASRALPASGGALRAGQTAPAFTLSDSDGKAVAEAELLTSHRALLLIFYRGYW